ncbi:MAG: aldo/keto reductase, partial [Anaerolineales bacterium]
LAVSDRQSLPRFIAAQYQYSLVERNIEFEFSDLCLSEGVGLTPWGPLGGGFLSGKYTPDKRPTQPEEGRLATQPASDEEAWERRNTERNWRILDAVDQVAKAHPGSTHPQIALAWLLAQPAVDSVVIGARTMQQLEDNLGAMDLQLTPEELAQLDDASSVNPVYPYRFLNELGVRHV